MYFFGHEGETGWVSRVEPYDGKEAHIAWLKEMERKNKSRRRDFQVGVSRRRAWEIACVESEQACAMNRFERISRFAITRSKIGESGPSTQPDDKTAKSSRPKKRKLSLGSGDKKEKTSPPRKRRKRTKSSGVGGAGSTKTKDDSQKLANKELTQFTVFCSKRRDTIRREHPMFTDIQIDAVLKGHWDDMSDEQKSKFIPMGLDVKNVSQMLPEEVPEEGKLMK